MGVHSLLDALGLGIEDPEEESFLLFSQAIPSQDLGFVDAKSRVLEISIGARDLVVHQSPTILSSNRGGGTTGAVLWKVTPLFASWISSSSNFLFKHGVLDASSNALELGCGISGLIGLSLSPLLTSYILTDQDYVMKLLNQNLEENWITGSSSIGRGRKSTAREKRDREISTVRASNIMAKPLDWEMDQVTASLAEPSTSRSFTAVIACDCIYNDALISPLVQTCIDICKLKHNGEPTVCIVAQQLRSADVFEGWLKAFYNAFRVWRIPDEELNDGLKSNSGFVVHIGILRQLERPESE